MDRQAACGIFATIIPVLLLAGYLTENEILRGRDRSARIARWLTNVEILVCIVCEYVSLAGVAANHPTRSQVITGLVGSYLALGGIATAAVFRVIYDLPPVEPRHDRHCDCRAKDQP